MLPVLQIEADILRCLRSAGRLVLTAPTGSGKTTQVPQMLLRGGIQGRIIVLQPRRLATRMVAARVAHELASPLGELVGYQTRHDSRLSHATRICFMTEGLFLRMAHSNPGLAGVGAVVLDEFHERNLDADVSLGLLRERQQTARRDLWVVVMSATLDAQAVGQYLQCPVLTAGGRLFPVDIAYLAHRSPRPPWELAAAALASWLERGEPGDVLIFMPGAYEIRRTIDACRRAVIGIGERVGFFPLHGSLPPHEQDEALAPAEHRKVIVATNVAETSITIEGVRHVIDSGLARIHRYDARRGINVLRVEPISQASSDQRAGRAGRVAPGSCVRLWPQIDQHTRPRQIAAEVRRLELAECLLQLKSMGVADMRRFGWLEPPREDAIQHGEALLERLGAMTRDGALTALGRRMARFPMHPRLSRLLLAAGDRGCARRAALWAALIGERDIVARRLPSAWIAEAAATSPACDLVVLERAMREAQQARFNPGRCEAIGLRATACREIDLAHRQYADLGRRAGLPMEEDRGDLAELIKCLLIAFPDHIAMRIDSRRPHCAMSGHKRVVLDADSAVHRAGPIVALELREIGSGDNVQTTLAMASEVELAWLKEIHPRRLRHENVAVWNDEMLAVEQVEQLLFDDLILQRVARPQVDPAVAADMLVEQITKGRLRLEHWDAEVEQWFQRVRLVAEHFPERRLIGYDAEDLGVILHEIVSGATRWSQVKDRSCLEAVRAALSWEDQQFVERMAPAEVQLPRGRRMKISYQPNQPPRGRAKIQDFYDMTDTPSILGGRRKILLEILGPNFRPLQVTDDLANFWGKLYPELRPQLKRRYPRHEWR